MEPTVAGFPMVTEGYPPAASAGPACRSAQQLAVRHDDGEVHAAPAQAHLRRVVHVDAAEVMLAHRGERLEELLARRLGPGALERFHGDLGGDEALERGERVRLAGRVLVHRLLVF